MELKPPVGFAHRGFFSVQTPDMFKQLDEALGSAPAFAERGGSRHASGRERLGGGGGARPGEDIDRATLGDLFSRAFIRVSYDKDGDLWAQDSDAPKVMITVDLVRRMIRIAAAWRFKQGTDPDARQGLALRANDAFLMARFRAVEPLLFLAEYYLFYDRGLLAAQLVHSLKLFGRIIQSAVREHDSEDLLQ